MLVISRLRVCARLLLDCHLTGALKCATGLSVRPFLKGLSVRSFIAQNYFFSSLSSNFARNKTNKCMKSVLKFGLFIILAVLFISPQTDARTQQDGPEVVPIVIVDKPGKPIMRTPETIPITATYRSSFSAICVRFNSNLGDVDIDVMNSSTGDMWSWTVVGGNIMAVLPISGDNGMYTITFTLANGDEYEGEFEL